MSENRTSFKEGDVIGGIYRVIRLLGEGGMGAVYEVEHASLGVHYALKTFTLDHGREAFLRDRFLAEGRVMARLSHPNLARVFDLGEDPDTGAWYFVMDLVLYDDGQPYTLDDLEQGAADEEHLVRWFEELRSALEYIHSEGIIHRDIKLNNVLLNRHGGVTLGDFGVSRFFGEKIRAAINVRNTMSMVTNGERLVMGTAGFMAPEVERGEEVTAAADWYSLGMVFFRLLTGMWYENNETARGLLENFEYDWKDLLPAMLSDDPLKRVVRAPRRIAGTATMTVTVPVKPGRRFWLGIAAAATALAALAFAAGFWTGWTRAKVIDEDRFFDDAMSIPEGIK